MKRSFGARAVAYLLPVFVVGTYDHKGKPDAMVAAWGGVCSSDPPSIAISIRPSRYTHRNLMEKMAFTISIPSVKYIAEADFFGIISGMDTDKFTVTGLTPQRAEFVDAPSVAEFPVVLECRVTKHIKIGAHTQFIGEILDVKIDESMLDTDGKPDLARLQLIGFDVFRSEYYTTGPVAGKAFSAGRKYLPG
jgi:flavin reductase (DIM6/NTAB) family NADH-FMN oxidoreductase RutF